MRDALNRWTHGEDWRTWVAHAVIALVICVILGPAIAAGFYLLREIDQVVYLVVDKKPLHPFDHVMDVAAPAAVAGLFALAF